MVAVVVVLIILAAVTGYLANSPRTVTSTMTTTATPVTTTMPPVTTTVYTNFVNTFFSSSCSISGVGGFEFRLVSDLTGQPVNASSISAVDKLECIQEPSVNVNQVVYLNQFSYLGDGWFIPLFPNQATVGGGLNITVSYQGKMYNFAAYYPPVGTNCVTLNVPSGNTTSTIVMNGSGSYCASQTTTTTQTSSSKSVPTYSMIETNVSAINSTLGLSLQLFAAPSNGSLDNLSISTEVVGARNVSTNVTVDNDWPSVANSFGICGAPEQIGVGFGIFQGYYDQSNYTNATPLYLYNISETYSCTTVTYGNFTYSFQPHSYVAELVNFSVPHYNESIYTGGLVAGYWQLGGTYQVFPAGNYTIMAADEWGQVAFLYFTVTN